MINRMQSIVLLLAVAVALATTPAKAAEIAISCGAVGVELELCKEASEAWAAMTGNSVKVISTPNSTNERLALYQQLLAAGADDIDVFQIDVIWPGILGNHFVDLGPRANKMAKQHFEPIVANNTVGGELKAMPWFTDAGVLFYRKDLLDKYGERAPATWAEMTAAAKKVQDGERAAGNDRMWGFVFQGKAYEGLTCDALEWIDSFGGGAIVDAGGKVTINNPRAVAAIDLAGSWIDNISPTAVLNYSEEEARGVFQSGNAVFMRNWPYAWSLAQNPDSPVRGKVGVVALPKGGADGKNSATLGGWQLAVSKYSKNKAEAIDLVLYLTSAEEQKRRAIKGSYNPTIAALYSDKEILATTPFFGDLYDSFVNAVARPSRVTGTQYNRVSNEFWNAVHSVLSGKLTAAESLAALDRKLVRISRNGKWK